MIKTGMVCVLLACWPAGAHTQSALDLFSLTFSPGPAAGDVVATVSDDAVARVSGAAIPEAAGFGAAAGGTDSTARGEAERLLHSIREAEEEIAREEARNGRLSRGLIERLESIAASYRELGDYPLAIAALDWARQILRVHDGLHSLSQIEIMAAMVDAMEQLGAYYESDSLQAEMLELAGRNAGDPRVPSILVAVADRQMDAVTEYFAAGGWERALERVDSPSEWDLEHIEILRNSRHKKPLNRLDLAIREMLTNGGYTVGETLDAREVLRETYGMIDAVNDHNEAKQRLITRPALTFDDEPQRDLALSAFRRARRLYSSALQTMLESAAYGSGEYLAIEQKMIDTYYFELEHVALYPDVSTYLPSNGRRQKLKRAVYGTGTSALEAKVVNLMSHGASAVEIANALMAVGDWHLLFSANQRALEMYQDAHDLLVREGVPVRAFEDVVSPATPVILAELTSDDGLELDPTHTYRGYVDVAVETGRYGDVKSVEITSKSAGTSPVVEQRARTHVAETRFRPRFENGQPMRSDRFGLRYYYDYTEWE